MNVVQLPPAQTLGFFEVQAVFERVLNDTTIVFAFNKTVEKIAIIDHLGLQLIELILHFLKGSLLSESETRF